MQMSDTQRDWSYFLVCKQHCLLSTTTIYPSWKNANTYVRTISCIYGIEFLLAFIPVCMETLRLKRKVQEEQKQIVPEEWRFSFF
jgi:hypothetical protein